MRIIQGRAAYAIARLVVPDLEYAPVSNCRASLNSTGTGYPMCDLPAGHDGPHIEFWIMGEGLVPDKMTAWFDGDAT